MSTKEGQDFQSLRSSDFPDTPFFLHLSNGTTFFHNKEYEKAISEWQEAAKLRPEFAGMTMLSEAASFRSNLDDVPLLGLLYALFTNANTGVAIVQSKFAQKQVFFKEGWIVFARTTKSEERLGNFLSQRDLLGSFNMDEVAAQAKESGERLGAFLVKGGLLTEKVLLELLDFQIKEILSDLFSWKDGDFFFEKHEVGEKDMVVSYTPLDIALFTARRALDFATFRKMIPNNKIIFRIPPYIEKEKADAMKDLDANEAFIFTLIDGNRNVDQLIKFSGNDEISIINILYRLVLMGLIKKSKDIGTYEDKEFKEVSRFLRTFLEVFRLVLDHMRKELGVRTKGVVDKTMGQLAANYSKLFIGVTMYKELPPDENKILKNISHYYPDPSDRLIFIDGFYTLIKNVLQEMVNILGVTLTKRVIAEIGRIRWDIYRFYTDSPMKRKVLEAFDKIVAQYPE
ncbi:MAG: hypothetical protein A2Y65_04400 [Deltaproteobacteria bacterium RBG_13_52_11]|nr:MAG: hypothetical protein A2Y65_04400 [Deltaproteobacteria bacterium RBG_13_52_11]